MRNVKIVSAGGIGSGTKVYDTDSGEEIRGVTAISIKRFQANEFINAVIELAGTQLEIEARGKFLAMHPPSGKLKPIKSITYASGETVEF